ncbi:MAG: alpha/beta fold hydrolase [Candidatus Pristimantibacillus sp.]
MGYFVEVEPRVNLYVEDIGQGQPVLFIHGWPVDHRMYEYQIDQLPKYGYRCILVDLRGFGRSDAPWESYSYDRMADDIYCVIHALGLEHVVLAGFSMGGAIAIRYMSRYAGRHVCKLLLFAAAAPAFTQRPGYPYGMTKEQVDELIELTYRDRSLMLEQFGQIFFESEITPSFRHWFNSLGEDASGHGTIATAISLRDEDLRTDLECINVPTYIFHGIHDKVCPFEFGILMNQGIPHSTLIRFENSGHAVFYDELELFNACLLNVLRQ